MLLTLEDNLPFITLTIVYQNRSLEIDHILVDTGSASTILASDKVLPIKIVPAIDDIVYTIRGVGGTEPVFLRQVEFLRVGSFTLANFDVEFGKMDYGFEINGILGMDFLTQAGAMINLQDMVLEFRNENG